MEASECAHVAIFWSKGSLSRELGTMYVLDFLIWRFVRQCAHFVEERLSVLVRRRACGNRRESDNLLGLVAIGRKPVLGERDYG
jgi:hypothetical protein